jgi:hypothetical protein
MSLFSRMPRIATIASLLFFTLTTAWAAFNIWTSEYILSKVEVQQALSEKFPRTVNYKGVFKVTVANPVLTLDPEANRLTTTVDTTIASSLLLAKDITGKIALNSGIKYDAQSRALRLDQPVVNDVKVDGQADQNNQDIAAIANLVVGEMLNNYPIYTFTPEQLELKGQRFEPGEITIGKDKITVEVIQK